MGGVETVVMTMLTGVNVGLPLQEAAGLGIVAHTVAS